MACKKIKALLPAILDTKEQRIMTEESFKSLMSFKHCLKINTDFNKYPNKVAQVWNVFFDNWRGKKYDYLLVTANDVQHDPMMVDYLVKCADQNPNAGIISCKVTRDLEEFKRGFGQQPYTTRLTTAQPKDPASFLLRKGVIEDIIGADEQFPCEFVERDLIYKAKLAGYDWIQPDIILSYHPNTSGTIGNPVERLETAFKRYLIKWGGDANEEKFLHPYNNLTLTYKDNE